MATPIVMPKQGNTVEECLLSSWRKNVGDQVQEGEVIADIETDKAAFEVSAQADGLILAEFWDEGDLVPVLENICVIGESGEDVEEFRPAGENGETEEAAEADSPTAPTGESAGSSTASGGEAVETKAETASGAPAAASAKEGEAAPLSPRARRFMEEHAIQVDTESLQGSGPNGRIMEQDVKRAYQEGGRISPVASKKMAEGEGKPAEGSGIGGLVTAADVGAAESAPAPEAAGSGDTEERFSNIRKLIADRMLQSVQGTAHYTLTSSADAGGLLRLRKRVKEQGENLGAADVNVGDMIAYAVVKALQQHPEINAHLEGERIIKRQNVNLGFACDTERGLMVPVVRNCEARTIGDLAREMKTLAKQATEGTISPDALEGGTFTVSNLGSLGIESFTPVLNPPQVGILGVGATELKPVREDGEVQFVEHVHLSLTCDHRAVDGAPGARFLGTVRRIIENFDLAVAL